MTLAHRRPARRCGSTSSTRGRRDRATAPAPADGRLLRRRAGLRVGADGPRSALLHLHDQRLLLRLGRCGRCRSRSSASFATSFLDQHADRAASRPRPTAWTFYLAIIVIQTIVDRRSASVIGEKISRAERAEAPGAGSARGGARGERRPAPPSCVDQAREAGVLDERRRMAREIHDTIAQGSPGSSPSSRRPSRPPPTGRRSSAVTSSNASGLARESLSEARRSVEAPGRRRSSPPSCPTRSRRWRAAGRRSTGSRSR